MQGGVVLSGGAGIGRSRTNACDIAEDLSLSYAGSASGVTASRTTPFCDVRPPFLPNMKFLGVYPLPFWGLQASATLQSTPGPEITASYSATNAEIAPSLGRDLSAGANATVLVDLIPKGHPVWRPHQPGGFPAGQGVADRLARGCRGCSISTTPSTPRRS